MEAKLILKSNPQLDEKSNVEKYYFVNEKQIHFIKNVKWNRRLNRVGQHISKCILTK